MNVNYQRLIAFLSLLVCHLSVVAQENVLWYNVPANNWNEALPIGNGFIGAMVFGDSQLERLQLNESTIWGGGPNNNIDPDAPVGVEEVRSLLNQKEYEKAQLVANKLLGPKGNSGMPYQLAGNLYINFENHKNTTDYRRDLNIDDAIASVSYVHDGVRYKREYFTSFTDNVLMVRLTADKPKMITANISLQSPLEQNKEIRDGDLVLSGLSSDHEDQKGQVKFNVITRVKNSGGAITIDTAGIKINKADTAVIYLSMATNFVNYKDISADPLNRAQNILNAASKKDYETLLHAHSKFYHEYYDRVKLDLGKTEASKATTDVRIREFAKGNDPQLAELYFQFGRYLLISSSQPGSQPANLQGIWNGDLKGAWDSKYTLNINAQMNYWPSEVTQLSELNTPFFDMISDLAVTGKETADVMYGARGWALHHNTDIWRITGIVDGAFWGLWPTASAWLCQHLWEHYLYTGDKDFLKKYYPIMKGAAQYFIDVLQPAENNWLVVSPSNSPENAYLTKGRTEISVTAGATMDNQLVYGLFDAVIKAAADLNIDKAFADSVLSYQKRLPPNQIGRHGQLQEWLEDLDSPTDHHRHVSHLYGMFPGNQISPFRNPELFTAVKNSMIYRGDVSTGWSMGWKINLWARLLDGNHAYKLITDQIAPVGRASGGTYPNLFGAHPPFQIDGNFGYTSGVAEMLMQSYDGFVYLLPALPDVWGKGSVKGLVARGGFIIDMDWDNHKITRLVVHSTVGGNLRLRLNQAEKSKLLKTSKGVNPNPLYKIVDIPAPLIKPSDKDLSVTIPENWLYDVKTKKGESYTLIGG